MLKNLLRKTEDQLPKMGVHSPEKLLKPGYDLLPDNHFWSHQSDGLAVFIADDFFQYYRLPINLKEFNVINNRFYIKPLLPLLSGDGRFFILAISLNKVRLIQCTHHSVNEMELKDIPGSLAEALELEDMEKSVQFHTEAQESGERPAIFHGQGITKDVAKDRMLRFFRQVDKGLQKLMPDDKTPLVWAGVDHLFPIYKDANTLHNLIPEKKITGNPEILRAEELKEKAWNIVEPIFQKDRKEAESKFDQFAATDQASNEVKEVVPAAYHSRVDVLFVANDEQLWGKFDPQNNEISPHQEQQPDDEDLLDLAATQTLLKGGTVYAVNQEEVPGKSLVAALFRY